MQSHWGLAWSPGNTVNGRIEGSPGQPQLTDPREPCPGRAALAPNMDLPKAPPSRGRAIGQKMGGRVMITFFSLLIFKMGPREEVAHSLLEHLLSTLFWDKKIKKKTRSFLSPHLNAPSLRHPFESSSEMICE